jgi:hypothetical protein
MSLPTHPSDTDEEEPTNAQLRWRVVIGAVLIVILLASVHLLRAALG